MAKISDIAWAAGYLEGEGCFLATFRGKYLEIYISVSSSDRDVLHKLHRILVAHTLITEQRSKFRDGCTRKRHYRFSISGSKAIGWMMTMYPFLGERRQTKIREILVHWKNYRKM